MKTIYNYQFPILQSICNVAMSQTLKISSLKHSLKIENYHMTMNQNTQKYDLEERTAIFGERIIALCKKIRRSHITDPLVNQLVRSGTSVGANYMEANGASSKRDFANKIFICKKEAQETKHWLRMLVFCQTGDAVAEIRSLWKEAQELTLIFQKIASSTRMPSV